MYKPSLKQLRRDVTTLLNLPREGSNPPLARVLHEVSETPQLEVSDLKTHYARRLQRVSTHQIPHTVALEMVAIAYGYPSYGDLRRVAKRNNNVVANARH